MLDGMAAEIADDRKTRAVRAARDLNRKLHKPHGDLRRRAVRLSVEACSDEGL
jgi:hypothetical protein